MPFNSTYGAAAVRAWGRGGGKLTANVDHLTVAGSGTSSSETTNSVTASFSGVAGSATYAWERVSGDASVTVSDATAATVTFSATGLSAGEERDTVWRCKVTVAGLHAYTPNVGISLIHSYPPLTISISPGNQVPTRAGAGSVNLDFVVTVGGGSGSYEIDLFMNGGDAGLYVNTGATPSIAVALTNGQVRSGDMKATASDTVTGASSEFSNTVTWTAVSTTV